MEPWAATLLSVGVVSVVSLVGALALSLPGVRSHRFLLVLVALSAGTLLGDAFLHLVPEAIEARGGAALTGMALWILAGFVAFFLLEVVLRSRHAHGEMVDQTEHLVEHAGHVERRGGGVAPFAWTNLLGDALHNFLDGAVIATAFQVDPTVGLATTVAVVIHEVPQELGDFAVLLRGGLSPRRALAFNFGSAVLAVAGALLVMALPVGAGRLESAGLPFIAGAFVYIAAADLIPELHHHSRGREAATILGTFLAGLAVMYGLLGLE